jgi:hypothetical protein
VVTLEPVLRALEGSTGVKARPDGTLVELAWRGQAVRFHPQVRALVRPPHLPLLREQLRSVERSLLVTRHVSAPLAERLRERGIAFADEAGNAFIETESWMVWVSGRSLSPGPSERATVSRSMWQVAYVLLRGGAEARTVRELGTLAGVSHGTAANALGVFEQRGWLAKMGHSHVLTDADAFLRAWEFGYPDRLRPALELGRAATPGARSVQAWADAVASELGSEGLLGGELAAERMGADIVAVTATLHVPRWDAETMRRFRLVPAKEGPIAIRQTFGTVSHAPVPPSLADPLLVRAELLSIDDERLDAARGFLRQQIEQRWSR